MSCIVCGGAGGLEKYDSYSSMKESLPPEHSCCGPMLQEAPSILDAAKQINSLILPEVFVPYSMVTIPIKQAETQETIIANLSDPLMEHFRNSKVTVKFDTITQTSATDARHGIMDAFFYDYYKYVCVNNRNRPRDDRHRTGEDVEPEYIAACKVVYNAMFGSQLSLQDQCLNKARQLIQSKDTATVEDTGSEGASGVSTDGGKIDAAKSDKAELEENQKLNTASETGLGCSHKEDVGPAISTAMSEQLEGVVYFKGRDVGVNDEYEVDSDDLFLVINKPRGLAMAAYFYYSRYYG